MRNFIQLRYQIWKAKRMARPWRNHMQALSDPLYVDHLAEKLFGYPSDFARTDFISLAYRMISDD